MRRFWVLKSLWEGLRLYWEEGAEEARDRALFAYCCWLDTGGYTNPYTFNPVWNIVFTRELRRLKRLRAFLGGPIPATGRAVPL